MKISADTRLRVLGVLAAVVLGGLVGLLSRIG
jgi:hypothetical protein